MDHFNKKQGRFVAIKIVPLIKRPSFLLKGEAHW